MATLSSRASTPSSIQPSKYVSRTSGLWFAVILGAVCLWVLSLPIFPTQDGPMHRYYIHVLDSLLQHRATYDVYRIRHPFPPYATHYASLLLLFHVFPYSVAEKVFVCAVFLCLGCGLRWSAIEIGPSGRWFSLLCAPLLMGWPLMMGFFNFTLGVGLLLICTALWQRMQRVGVRALVAFTLVLAVLTFTHPIPLLLLILVCDVDVLLSFLFRERGTALGAWARRHRLQLCALGLSVLAALFPALAFDSSKTSSTLQLFRFHPEYFRTSLLLTGISPYNSRSLNVWIDLYRLCLYALFGYAMWTGGRACVRAFRERHVNFGTTLFVATAALTLALPFIPNTVNGSDYFSSRLIFLLWPAAILGASAAPAPTFSRQKLFIGAGAVFCLLTLIPAQLFIRPAAQQLHAAEQQTLPAGVPGSLLMSKRMDEHVRFSRQLGFDPLKWGVVLAFVHADDVVLDSPWIDQKITPIEAVPGGPELVDDISYTGIRKPDSPYRPLVQGRSLPGYAEARIVRDSAFMLLAGTPEDLAQGLATQLSPSEAAKYQCGPVKDWYVVCTSR